MTTHILIEDHVVPQLLTSAIEAYEIGHRSHVNGTAKLAIETYGLLWGYMIPERHGHSKRVVCTIATIESSALRHQDWVKPQIESLEMKRDFFHRYWPQLELVGTFHSHPYDCLSDVNEAKGWRASSGDMEHWPWIHEMLVPELSSMAHLIVTITSLERKGCALPQPLAGGEGATGFVLSSDLRKFWIKAYSSELDESSKDSGSAGENIYTYNDDTLLAIPSLVQRFRL